MHLKQFLRLTLFLSAISVTKPSLAQTPNSFMTLPYETLFEIKGIKTKLILESITGTPEGSTAELTIGLQDPQTGQWVYFEAEDVRMTNEGGLHPPFDFILKQESRESDTNFVSEILAPGNDRVFFWKCKCEETLPRFPM